MKKIICILLFFLAVIISIQPVFAGSNRGKDEQSVKIGFMYRNVIFQMHPLRAQFEKEIKKLQEEHDGIHRDASSNPEMKKIMEEIQVLIGELQGIEKGTDDYRKKEEEITKKEKGFEGFLQLITEKESAITAKQQEFYKKFERDLEKVALEIGKKKNLALVVSVLARGYDGHEHGNQTLTPSYNYFVYSKKETSVVDITKELIHRLEVMYKFREGEVE